MQKLTIEVQNEIGLHARPAATFVREAAKFESSIKIRNLTTGGDWVSAKSILNVLALGVEKGNQIELIVEGGDESKAVTRLAMLISSNFASL